MQSPDSQAIVKRFFAALYRLKDDKKIRGKQTFTREYGINRWNLNTLEKEPERDIFQVSWLSYLVRDYGVSPMWLLTGFGEFYQKRRRPFADLRSCYSSFLSSPPMSIVGRICGMSIAASCFFLSMMLA